MKRRQFLSTSTIATAAFALGGTPILAQHPDWDAVQRSRNNFAESDTIFERIEKLNALMGTDLSVHLHKWLSERRGTIVYLRRNGRAWSGPMTPSEFFHWTAQVALGYRIAKAQG